MDFSTPSELEQLRERARSFCRMRLASNADDWRERWRRAAEFGFTGLSVPEALGGRDLDASATMMLMAAFGEGCADLGLGFSLAAHLFACAMPIVESGDPHLVASVVPALARGEWIGANAISEEHAGSDVFALRTTARRDGDHYVLDGTKSYVTNATVADVLLVYAVTDRKLGHFGISTFVVDVRSPGVTVGQPFQKVGLQSAPLASVYFEGCRVPSTRRIGAEGQGATIFRRSMAWERACLFGLYLGAMQRQLDACIGHARTRRQGGKAIARHQAVAHRIVDMKVRLESARLLLTRACWALDEASEDAELWISIAKLVVSEAAVQSGLDAIHVHGGAGCLQEVGIEVALRDAIPSTVFSGTSDIQRNLIAHAIGL